MTEKNANPTTLPPYHAVIFDLDGLVLDTEPTFLAAWQGAAAELGVRLDEAFCRSLSGLSYAAVECKVMNQFGSYQPTQRFRDLSSQLWRDHVERFGINTKPGVFEVLDLLRRRALPYCLATNSNRSIAIENLRLAGMEDCFPVMVSRDEVRCGKPEPDLFLEAAKRLNVAIETCIALEDSAVGIESACRAGAIPLMIPGDYVPVATKAEGPFRVLSSLSDVAELLDTAGA